MVVVLDRVTSTTTLSNSASETTMYTYSVPANMGAKLGEVILLDLPMTFLNGSGADRTYTIRIKFGGVTHLTEALIPLPSAGGARPAVIQVRIQNTGSGAQWITAMVTVGLSGNDWTAAPILPPSYGIATGAVDQTTAQTLAVSVQSDAATATQTITTRAGLLTVT